MPSLRDDNEQRVEMPKEIIPVPYPKGDGCWLTKVNEVGDVLSTGGEELSILMVSVLDRAFKGEI